MTSTPSAACRRPPRRASAARECAARRRRLRLRIRRRRRRRVDAHALRGTRRDDCAQEAKRRSGRRQQLRRAPFSPVRRGDLFSAGQPIAARLPSYRMSACFDASVGASRVLAQRLPPHTPPPLPPTPRAAVRPLSPPSVTATLVPPGASKTPAAYARIRREWLRNGPKWPREGPRRGRRAESRAAVAGRRRTPRRPRSQGVRSPSDCGSSALAADRSGRERRTPRRARRQPGPGAAAKPLRRRDRASALDKRPTTDTPRGSRGRGWCARDAGGSGGGAPTKLRVGAFPAASRRSAAPMAACAVGDGANSRPRAE